MPTITYVNDNGTVVEEELDNRTVTFVEDDDTVVDDDTGEFRPAVVERVEYDHEGQMSSITTACGETENRRESDEKPRLVVEGIITEPQKDQLYSLKYANELTLISDVITTPVEVRRITVEQNTDLIKAYFNDGTVENIFSFQAQLRVP